MAYIKIKPVKTSSHLSSTLSYIADPNKTDNEIWVTAYKCIAKYAAQNFEEVYKQAKMKKGNNLAHHICISFSPEDNISPHRAIDISQEVMKRMYPQFQYVLACHIDKKHIHCHIIVNAVDYINFKKLHSNKESLTKMRNIGDELCRENGLSVIDGEGKTQRAILAEVIDKAFSDAHTFDDFLNYMQSHNYEIKMDKYLSFKPDKSDKFIRAKSLGTAYTEKSIRDRISGEEMANRPVRIYADKTIKMPHRKRLKRCIDEAKKSANSYEEFLNMIREYGYEVKQGKHLAFRHNSGERFLRTEKLGYVYTEDMLRLYFEDPEEYKRLAEKERAEHIQKLIKPENDFNNRYISALNVNTEIRVLNYLKESNINNYEELLLKISDTQKQADKLRQELKTISGKISGNREIVKAMRYYWQYKPVFVKSRSINNTGEQKAYNAKYSSEINRYKRAVEIINNAKLPDGSLPQSNTLNAEIQRYQNIKDDILRKLEKTELQLSNYLNIKENMLQLDVKSKTDKVPENIGTINL